MKQGRITIYLGGVFIFLIFSCTSNPFFKEKIDEDIRDTLTGTVIFNEGSTDNSGVLVYLDGYELFTESDSNGNFSFTLPNKLRQPGEGLTGIHNIYFYIANYELTYYPVSVLNGQFVYGSNNINTKGELSKKVTLSKLLSINTTIEPKVIDESFRGIISVKMELDNEIDSVTVLMHQVQKTNFASIFLTKDNTTHLIKNEPSTLNAVLITERQEYIMDFEWGDEQAQFADGDYNIVPYIVIQQEQGIPSKILQYYNLKGVEYKPNYLRLPYTRSTPVLKYSKGGA